MLRSAMEQGERMSIELTGPANTRTQPAIDITNDTRAGHIRPDDIGPDHIGAGTAVEVQCRFDQRWTRGFTVVDVTREGYRLRRQSDGSVLPAWFPREQLRPTA